MKHIRAWIKVFTLFVLSTFLGTTLQAGSVTSDTQTEGFDLVHTVTMSGGCTIDETYYAFILSDNTTTTDDYGIPIFSAGVTYDAGTGLITVPDCVTTFTITIPTTDDALDEDSESYDLTVGGQTATGTITDNDETPDIAVVKTETVNGTGAVGDTITYSFLVTNTGNVPLTGVKVDDTRIGVIDLAVADLAIGADAIVTAIYTITQADINDGNITNQAVATGTSPLGVDVNDTSDDPSDTTDLDPNGDGNPDDPTVTYLNTTAVISAEKIGIFMDENADGYANVGETISYEFNVTNIGNVTLYDANIIDDNAVITGGPTASMIPGESDTTTFMGIHTITWQDIIDGVVINQAIVTAKDPQENDVNDTSDDPQNPVNNDSNGDGEPDDVTSIELPIKLPDSTNDTGAGATGQDVTIDIVNNDNGGTFALDVTTVTLTVPVGATGVVTDADGDMVGFVVPGEGTWSVNETGGEVTFSPEDGYVGDPAPVEYTIEDTQGNPTTSEISINYPPVANDDNATAQENEVVTLNVLANDQNTTDPLDKTSVRLIDPSGNEVERLYVPSEGTWTVDTMTGEVTFDPDMDFSGDATITYVVREINGDVSNEATITIVYPGSGFPIIARDDLDTITEYAPTVIDVLANDGWGSNGPGTQAITFIQPIYGTVALDDNGTADDPTDDVPVYTPVPDHNDIRDSFTYTIEDAQGNTATATVTLNVVCASSQTSDGGDALGLVSMLLLAIMTAMSGLYFIRREEERGEA